MRCVPHWKPSTRRRSSSSGWGFVMEGLRMNAGQDDEGKGQKAKVKRQKVGRGLLTFAFCLLPFAFSAAEPPIALILGEASS
jgi:hypothetical protein